MNTHNGLIVAQNEMNLQCDGLNPRSSAVEGTTILDGLRPGTQHAMIGTTHRGHSGEVDALRAVAMLAVVGLHAHLLPFGWMGVWLFYVISGYVVTLSVIERVQTQSRLDRLKGFLRRRAARIMPVYFAYIAVGLLVAAMLGLDQDPLSLASLFLFFDNATMVAGQGRINGWPSGHLWTLSTEMQFYAVYGTALCLLPARHVRSLLIAFLVICPVARLAAGVWLDGQGWKPLDAAFAVYAMGPLHFDIFAMGGLLAIVRQAGPSEKLARPLLITGFAALSVYAAVYARINYAVRHEQGVAIVRNVISGILFGEYREVVLYSAVGLAMTGLVALAANGGGGGLGFVLRLPALQWLGRISYGGYLFHPLGLKCATLLLAMLGVSTRYGGIAAHVLQFSVGLGLTVALAALSFRWLETPCRRLLSGHARQGARLNTAPETPHLLNLDPR